MTINGQLMKNWKSNFPTTEESIDKLAVRLKCKMPADYVRFMIQKNGGEGYVGDNYLILWKIDDIEIFNDEYEVNEYAPGLLLIGSNGGGEGYGYDLRDNNMPIVTVPFIGMSLLEAKPIADTLTDLITKLSK